jgi:ankyrin repeat protein
MARALLSAVLEGDEHQVKELLDTGADVNYYPARAQCLPISALHLCIAAGHLNLLDTLLGAGALANLVVKGHERCTPLRYAVEKRDTGSVQLLLQYGADRDDSLMWTAVDKLCCDMIRVLHRAGCSLQWGDARDSTVLDYAVDQFQRARKENTKESRQKGRRLKPVIHCLLQCGAIRGASRYSMDEVDESSED